jgi:hypothetical protein
MRTRVIPTTILIARRGEKINFEIKLPKNAKKITGIKITVTGKTI